MIDEIINKYEQFSDALVLSFVYYSKKTSTDIDVSISCMNKLNDYEYETITISFIDVISFRFVENEKSSSVWINAALLKSENEIITFDFFPLIYGRLELKENENSDFMIKCREVNYTQIK